MLVTMEEYPSGGSVAGQEAELEISSENRLYLQSTTRRIDFSMGAQYKLHRR